MEETNLNIALVEQYFPMFVDLVDKKYQLNMGDIISKPLGSNYKYVNFKTVDNITLKKMMSDCDKFMEKKNLHGCMFIDIENDNITAGPVGARD